MQGLVASGTRWKTKDLERLPEEPFLSYEIIDGELIVSRRPHLRHAVIIGTLCAQVYPAVRALQGVLLVGPGIVWSEEAEDTVAPDLAIVLPDRFHLASGRALSGIPNIVMEVISEGSVEVDYPLRLTRVKSMASCPRMPRPRASPREGLGRRGVRLDGPLG